MHAGIYGPFLKFEYTKALTAELSLSYIFLVQHFLALGQKILSSTLLGSTFGEPEN